MRRPLALTFLVWACSCGIHGHLPAWVATRAANAETAQAPAQQLCVAWANLWNQEAAQARSPLRIHHVAAARPYGEALAKCVWVAVNTETTATGCYRGLIDTSLRSWNTPTLVNCDHPWAHPVPVKPIA